ncbi:MAG: transposase, partial [Methanobrevibacter sp.]|nr:transposase [Candidatus Methanoflexus mossambicus]
GNYFPNEKKIIIILDNYSVHIAYLVRLLCKILNITLIYLTSYSPDFNPIEQVWRTIKGELYQKYIVDEDFLSNRFTTLYYEQIDKPSFSKKWKKKFIAKK